MEPTHIDGHTLDLVVTSATDDCVRSLSVPSMFSDHAAIHIELNMTKPRRPEKTISYRKLKSIDASKLSEDLIKSELFTNRNKNLENSVSQYNTVISGIIDKHAPVRHHKMVLRPTVPWFTDEIHEAKRLLRQLERQWRRTRLTVHREMFQHQLLLVRMSIAETKATYTSMTRSMNVLLNDQKGKVQPILHI